MKVRFIDLLRHRTKSKRTHVPRLGAVPLSGAKYRLVGNDIDDPGCEGGGEASQENFRRTKSGVVKPGNAVSVKVFGQSSSGLQYCAPNLHQYGQQLSSRLSPRDKIAEKYIQGIYAESRDWQIKKYEGAIDYTLADRIWDKVMIWISSYFVKLPFLNRLKPIAIFFVSCSDKGVVQKYENPFRQRGCRIEIETSLKAFLRSVKVKVPPIVHYLSEPKVDPVTDNGVLIATFDYEGSKDAAERAKRWCGAAYGYCQNWWEQSQSVKFYDRFYAAVLQGHGVLASHARISKAIEIAPSQFTAKSADFRISIPKANVNLQVKGAYDTTRNI